MNALLRPFWVCAIIIMSTAETLPQKKLIFDYYSDGGGGTFAEKTEPISSTNKFMMDDISIVTEILNSYFGYNAVTLENAEYFVEASSIIVIDTKDQSNNNNTATKQSLSYPDQCFLNNDNDYYYDNTMTKNIAVDNNNNITLFDNNNMTITATSLRKEFCVMSSQNRGTCECIPGFFFYDDKEGCIACPQGKFKAVYGNDALCIACPDGSRSTRGQRRCWPCPPNTYSSACIPCPEYTEAPDEGSAVCRCIAGTALDFFGERCVPCRPGQYSKPSNNNKTNECVLCDGLTTTSVAGATVCDECVAGTSKTIRKNIIITNTTPTPNDKCEACPSGTFFSEKKECVACSSGSYTDAPMQTACASCHTASSSYYQPEVGQTSCLTCTFPAGSMGQKNGSGCVCPPGTELDYSGQACAPCQPGFFSREGEGCSMCPGYTTSAGWGASTCDGCAAGYSGVVCQPCAAGFYENEGICLACPPATFSSMQGATACDKCLFYLVKAAGATQCRSSCPIGSFVNNDDGCIFCAAGKYQKNLTEECVECDSGTYAPSEGLTACLICPRYTTTSNGGNKMACACAPGTIIDYTERQCVPCPPGSMCGDEHDTLCAIGTYNPFEAATACLPCAAARFEGATICPSSNNTIIITCPDNFFFMQENNSCVACSTRCLEENYYISKECGDTEDIVCAPNVTCSQPNEFKTPNERCQRCRSTCPAGFFIATPCSPNADTVCMPCTTACPSPAFFVSSACNDGVNDLRCEECSVPGTFTDDLGTCRACDPGSIFMLNEGCLRCPTDTPMSNANRTACVQRCPAGNLHFLFFYFFI